MPDRMSKLAVLGAGLIGRKHCELIASFSGTELAVIIDPVPSVAELAEQYGAKWYPSLDAFFEADRADAPAIDGAVIATPNDCHAPQALRLIERKIPLLIEKPIADSAENARLIQTAAAASSIPVLVGHHRRHNPLIKKAKTLIDDGAIGRPLSVSMLCWLMKPDHYFDVDWRRRKGAGPIYINLSHDLDLLRYLLGDVVQVYAQQRHDARGYEVEDTACIMLNCDNGALATISLSDTIVAPWSWEHTAGENPAYPRTSEHAYLIGGTHGSLGLPNLSLWQAQSERSWWQPMQQLKPIYGNEDPFISQLEHFTEVISGTAQPLITPDDGVANVQIIDAIKISAETGQPVPIGKAQSN